MLSTLIAVFGALVGGPPQAAKLVVRFDDMSVGQPPAGFTSALTGDGGPVAWLVQSDANAPSGGRVLVQTSADHTNHRFPLCVNDDFVAKDLDLSVRLKPISGTLDQAGGVVWRYQSAANYYVARANALEGNVVLYKVENGKRSDLKPTGAGLFAYGKKVPVAAGQWHELRVAVRGQHVAVSFDGQHLFDVEDPTFTNAGRVGLWTKADSVTAFDDLTADSADRE